MPTIQIQADISVDALIQAAEQLSQRDLRRLTTEVLALSAKGAAPSLRQGEAELLIEINRRLPADVQQRYDELIAKRDGETLTANERHELLDLTKQAEAADAGRVAALTQLAAIRGSTLGHLLEHLQLAPPAIRE